MEKENLISQDKIGKSFLVKSLKPDGDWHSVHEDCVGKIGTLVFAYEFNGVGYYGLDVDDFKNVEFLAEEIEEVES